MTDSSVNNTSSLSNGSPSVSAKRYSTAAATIASGAVAQYNLKNTSDTKVLKLREILKAHVSSWSNGDKERILVEYGFDASSGDINDLVVEAMIIYMDEAELQAILRNVKAEQRTFARDFRKAEAKAKQLRRQAFIGRNFEDAYTKFRQSNGQKMSAKKISKFVKSYDKDFKGSKVARGNYSTLKRQLEKILKEMFTNNDLIALGAKMGLFVEETGKRGDLVNQIIQKTILYVDLVTGKNKNYSMAGAFSDPEPYNDILQFTAFSFVTGRTGMSAKEIIAIKKKAKEAKDQMRTGLKGLDSKKYTNRIFSGKNYRNQLKSVSGKGGALSAEDIARNDTGVLKDYSVDELIEFATQLGVKVPKKLSEMDLGKLKKEIYTKLADKRAAYISIKKKAEKARAKGDIEKAQRLEAQMGSIKSSVTSLDRKGGMETVGNGIPVVKFNKSGEIASELSMAIPVVIAGYAAGRDTTKESELFGDPEESKEKQSFLKRVTGFFGRIGDKAEEKRENIRMKVGSVVKKITGLSRSFGKKPEAEDLIKFAAENGYVKDGETPGLQHVTRKVRKDYKRKHNPFGKKPNGEDINLHDQGLQPLDTYEMKTENGTKELRSGVMDLVNNALRVFVVNPGVFSNGGNTVVSRESSIPNTESDVPTNDSYKTLSEKWSKNNRGHNFKIGNIGKKGSMLKSFESNGNTYYRVKMGNTWTYVDKETMQRDLDGKGLSTETKSKMFSSVIGGLNKIKAKKDDFNKKLNSKEVKEAEKKHYIQDNYLSPSARRILPKDQKNLSRANLTPVYVVNNQVGTDLLAWNKNVIGLILDALSLVPIIGPGFKGMKTAAEAAGILSDGEFARGAKVNVKRGSAFSSFISGDSLTGKPNEERVDIDWNKKEYKVTPIKKFATGGAVNETSGQVRSLSASEKNTPMSVGISSHLVSYTNKVSGDDGSGKALKVYMVNNPLSEAVGGVTLGGLLVSIDSKLTALQSLLAEGNGQTAALIQTTAKVGAAVTGLQGSMNSGSAGNPFTSGFPTELDSILEGV